MITKTRNIPDGKALLKTLPYEPYLEAEKGSKEAKNE